MKISKFITNVTLNDNNSPGQIISLNVHQIDGGYIGIDTNFTEEVANYIINPYEECDFVKIVDPDGNDDTIDPPLTEDTIAGYLRVLVAMDTAINRMDSLAKLQMKMNVAHLAGISYDELEILIGSAQVFLDKSNEI
jgi:hypothetical protein